MENIVTVADEIRFIKELESRGVMLYPNDDGGLWYNDPNDGSLNFIW